MKKLVQRKRIIKERRIKMNNLYPQVLGIMDTLNEWNEKLNKFAGEHLDNVLVGTVVLFAIIVVAFWAIGALNKK